MCNVCFHIICFYRCWKIVTFRYLLLLIVIPNLIKVYYKQSLEMRLEQYGYQKKSCRFSKPDLPRRPLSVCGSQFILQHLCIYGQVKSLFKTCYFFVTKPIIYECDYIIYTECLTYFFIRPLNFLISNLQLTTLCEKFYINKFFCVSQKTLTLLTGI